MKIFKPFLLFFLFLATVLPAQDNIWPGDVNNNGVVNAADLLFLGPNYNAVGPARKAVSIAWQSEALGTSWPQTSAVAGLDLAYVDCNGDGTVNAADVDAIVANFGNRHFDGTGNVDEVPEGVPGISPSFGTPEVVTVFPNSGEVVIPVSLGDSAIAVENLRGLSFIVKLDKEAFNVPSASFEFDAAGWLPTSEDEAISFAIPVPTGRSGPGDLAVAYTKIDNSASSGSGLIGNITVQTGFILEGDVPDLRIIIDSIILLDNASTPIPVLGTEIILETAGFIDSVNVAQSICQGESFAFNNLMISDAGTYRDTLDNQYGGDSIVILELAIEAPIEMMRSESICQGDAYLFNNKNLTAAGLYRDTVVGANGCDQYVVLDLTIEAPVETMRSESICQGDAYLFNNQNLTAAGLYRDTIVGANGCAQYMVLDLAVEDTLQTVLERSICQGDVFLFNEQNLTTAGEYRDTLVGINGCNLYAILKLTVEDTLQSVLNRSICAGESFLFNEQNITASGSYRDTLMGANGCNQYVVLNLAVEDTLQTVLNRSICAGDNFLFNQINLTTPGSYRDTLVAANGCDQYVVLNLSVEAPIQSTVTASICDSEVYAFGSQQLTTGGQYERTLTAANGCDSLIVLDLAILPTLTTALNGTICNGSSFDFMGQTLTEAGDYSATLTGANGCDSVVNIALVVIQSPETTINQTICQSSSFAFGGQDLVNAGVYMDTLATSLGCDSFVVLNLAVSDRYETELNKTICEGESMNFNGRNLEATGAYQDTFVAINGCDSIVTLNLAVATKGFSQIQAEICQGGSRNFGGQVLTEAGVYMETLSTSNGCDSLVELTLSVAPIFESVTEQTICQGDTVNFYNFILTTTNSYMVILQTDEGCDSMVIMNLQVLEGIETNIDSMICPGESMSFGGALLTEAGTYNEALMSSTGCDSSVVLNLTIGTPGVGDCMSVGIEEELLESIEIYPNPVNQNLFVASPTLKMTHLRLVNLTGQVVSQQVFDTHNTTNQAKIGMQDLMPGVYWVLVQTELGLRQEKIVKF